MQIEDFVDLFNRVYIIDDLMWQENMVTKRFLSKWVPGDFIAGSGGPPIDTSSPPVDTAPDMDNESKDDGSLGDGKAGAGGGEGSDDEDEDEDDDDSDDDQPPNPFTDNPMYPFVVSEPTTINVCLYQPDRR